jgi:uncharacterized protein YndB with AHSA1/START domain
LEALLVDTNATNTLPDIRQTLVLNAPIQKVWNAVSTAEGIAAWFMPNDFQPVVGHAFHLDSGPFGKSPFTLIHSGWDADRVTEFGQPYSEIRERMFHGWVGIKDKLASYVEA